MSTLFGLLLTIGVFVVLPLLVLGVVLRVAVALLILPIKLVGVVFKVVFGALGALIGVLFSGFGILLAVGLGLLLFVALPLLPLLILGGLVWLAVKLFSGAAAVA
jgi:hypothetical protein